MTSDGSDARSFLWRIVDRLTALGLQIGGIAFVVLTAYLLWGVYSESFVYISTLKIAERTHALNQIHLAIRWMLISGVVTLISAAYQFYYEETCGYLVLMAGAAMRWGVPALTSTTQHGISLAANSVPAHIVAQYVLLGSIAVALSAPLIVYDLWQRLRGTRHWLKDSSIEAFGHGLPKVNQLLFCWQTPHCREHMREVCEAFPRKKSCWRLKSGCFCGEDRLLKLINLSAAPGQQEVRRPAVFHESLTPAQKRARCRDCFLYKEHQELKYRIISPLVFPIVFGAMYYGFKAIWQNLHKALLLADKFSKHVSYLPGIAKGTSPEWANVSAASSAVEWLFVVLLGLILITYALKLVEFLVFDLQI